jgi:hypothetical protein
LIHELDRNLIPLNTETLEPILPALLPETPRQDQGKSTRTFVQGRTC